MENGAVQAVATKEEALENDFEAIGLAILYD